MTLKTRKPTGAVPWPLVLLEGPEKAGKSWAAAELSASEKVGQTYWIDIGEGAADEYGAIPGARYLVVEHDGSFNVILSAVEEIRALAAKAQADGDKPVALVIDSMSAEWELLKEWAHGRATERAERKAAKFGKAMPDEVSISMDLWNDATAKHRRLMTLLLTFPGIVVITARGKQTVATDDNGKPIEGSRDYKVEGHKTLAFDASVWVRMSRESAPMVIGCRSVHHGIRPGVDKPKPVPNFTVEWLVFDALQCDPSKAHVRDLPTDELGKAQARVWELAQQLEWDGKALAAAYQKANDGQIKDATAEELDEYCGVLAAELEQQKEAA